MNKRRYNVSLNPESVEKVEKLLKKAKISLSGYLTVLVDEFARILDETGASEKLDNMTMTDAFQMIADVMQGIEQQKKEAQEDLNQRKEKKKKVKLK